MSFFKTTGGRLILFFVFVISIALCLFGGYSYYQAYQNKNIQIEQELGDIGGRLQTSLPSLLWKVEMEQMQKVLTSEVKSGMVFAVIVTDERE